MADDTTRADFIHPALLERLGRLVNTWALVEAAQNELFSFIVNGDPGLMYVVTQNVAAKTITSWIRTLLPIRLSDERTVEAITTILNAIDDARGDRNTLVHGIWRNGPEPETALVNTIKWERPEFVRHELVTVADLNEIIGYLSDIVRDLHFVGKRLGFLRPRRPQ